MSRAIACVTGGTGMVGRRIVSALVEIGYDVRVLSRQYHADEPNVTHYKGDVSDESMLVKFIAGAESVFHCAAELNIPSAMWQANVIGTEQILKACRAEKIKYFCYMSSAGVVGRTNQKIVTEDTLCHPQDDYEHSKLAAEKLVKQGISGASVVILRPTNVIDSDRPGALGLAIHANIISRLKLFIKGAECAHIVHADDVAAAAVFFMGKDFLSPECFFVSCDHEPLNTYAGLWALYQAAKAGLPAGKLNFPLCLPIFVPYLVRKMFRGTGNKGDVRYSSDKLISYGFYFSYGLTEIVRRFAR